MITFGELIKFKRAQADISARHLAKLCNVSPSYMSKIEAGTNIPSAQVFARLVRVLRLNDQEVFLLLGILDEV